MGEENCMHCGDKDWYLKTDEEKPFLICGNCYALLPFNEPEMCDVHEEPMVWIEVENSIYRPNREWTWRCWSCHVEDSSEE